MDVTFRPAVFNNKPVEEAMTTIDWARQPAGQYYLVPMTPFPIPLTTPPDTRMYLVMVVQNEHKLI